MQAQTPVIPISSASLSTAEIAATRPVAASEIIEHEIEDDLVLYDPRTDAVHVLNPTAAALWWLCDGRRTGQEIASHIARLYGRQLPDIEEEVLETLGQLLRMRAVTTG